MKYYIVYDGRAKRDEEDAWVLECIGEMAKEKAAAEFNKKYSNSDAILFEYDWDGKKCTNGQIID